MQPTTSAFSISATTPLTFCPVRVGAQVYRVCTASLPQAGPNPASQSSSQPSQPKATQAQVPLTTTFSETLTWPDPSLFRYLIGPRGSTLAKLRTDCGPGIDIRVPGATASDHTIRIRGTSAQQVRLAKQRIQDMLVAAQARDRMGPYTHFVALPLPLPSDNPEVHARLAQVQHAVIAHAAPLLPRTVRLAPIATTEMHLTLLMLRLPTAEHVATAVRALKALAPRVYDAVKTQTLLMHLCGLATFGDPTRTGLVYVGAREAGGEVQSQMDALAQVVVDGFAADGLVPQDEAKLPNLHLTLIRAKPAAADDDQSPPSGTPEKRCGARPTFDATNLLEQFRDVDVAAKVRIPSVQLLKRQMVQGPHGSQYFVEAEIALP